MGEYGFTRGVAELPYLSMLVDIFIGSFVCTLFEKRFNKAMAKNNGKPIPEERLSPMIFGSIFFAIGLFLLAWSGSYPEHVHWIVPTIGSSFIGFGLITIFLPCMNYIIDCYLMAASTVAANLFEVYVWRSFPFICRSDVCEYENPMGRYFIRLC